MNIYELASEILLTQPSLAETSSFLEKPLNLLLVLDFCFPVDKHTGNWCICCKSVDLSCWTKHNTWYCAHPVSQRNTEKLQNTRSKGPNWVLHSSRLSGPDVLAVALGACLVMVPSVCVWEIVATFHSSSHLEHWVLDYRSLLLLGKYRISIRVSWPLNRCWQSYSMVFCSFLKTCSSVPKTTVHISSHKKRCDFWADTTWMAHKSPKT